MKFCIATFRSRTNTYGFIDALRGVGVEATAVNTPSEVRVGCGLSARFDCNYLGVARRMIYTRGFGSFVGIYSVETFGLRRKVGKIG